MQKKLIALAIAGLVSSAAFAQSNVTIYGVVDASIDITDNGDTTATNGVRTNKISSNQSRIGFKGTEDLGDGLKALFQIETAINSDGTATTNLNSRNTFVGLADSWGQILAGQYDTPYKTSTRGLDVFGDYLADNRNLLGKGKAAVAGNFPTASVSFDGRAANTVRYDSNDISGFKFAVAYAAGAETATLSTQDKGTLWSASGSYAFTSAWNASLAYEKHDFGAFGTGTLATGTTALNGLGNVSEKAWKLGIGYKEGALRAGFVYEKISDDFTVTNDHKAWSLGGGYTVGSNEFKLAYTVAGDIDGTANSGAKQWAAGVDHILSKRTKVYASYVKLSNDSAAAYGLTGAGGNTTGSTAALGAGADPSAWQFGVKHTF